MPLVLVDHYTREQIQANPDVLVVFGDNIDGIGYGGQAAAARGEPNAVGIPTLWSPGTFYHDSDLEIVRVVIDERFKLLVDHLMIDFRARKPEGTVWWPSAGVGTGLARLPESAPRIMAYIEGWYAALKAISDGS